ncbi:DUF1801 domain-containing protein [Luteococcus peritonei]|uniref:DUF1801 domain-containing protein n=1 Tax=Luteococcus peritonei TaxID=88874 RepID=A0ABW4RRY2_9ACTN
MARQHATTLDDFFHQLPPQRLEPARELFRQIDENLDDGHELTMFCGMPTWVVPHSRYPRGHHTNPELGVARISLGNQGGHLAVYDMGLYADPDVLQWFVDEYRRTGWTPNMGRSCIRFTAMTRIPYELVGQLAARISLEEFITRYEANDPRTRR